MRDDLVGRGSAVEDEVGTVGAEHLRCVTLRLDCRADVDQQIAEIDVGVAQVVAEDLLAEMLEEQLAGGRFAVELAALVAGTRERDVRLGVVGHQPAEERRQQARAVFRDARDHLLGVESRGLLAEEDAAVHFAEHIGREGLRQPVRVRERPQRSSEAGGAHRSHQLARGLEPIAVDCSDVCADGRVFEHVALVAIADLDLEALRAETIEQRPYLAVVAVDERHHLQQLVEGNRDRGRLDGVLHHPRAPSSRGRGLEALDVEHAVVLFRALDFLGEARESMAVLLQCAQVREPRAVGGTEVLAGHDDRNAGRIGNHADRGDAARHLRDGNASRRRPTSGAGKRDAASAPGRGSEAYACACQ